MYEHTIRVPFAIRGPGIAANQELGDVVAMVDILPTLLDLAGGAVPPTDKRVDGRSFAPRLQGRSDGVDRTAMMVEFYSLASNPPDEPPCAAGQPVIPGRCFDTRASHSDIGNNTFIGLRIVNSTHDLTYAEYTDVRDLYDFNQVYVQHGGMCA